jgi:hypothetical protein
VIEGSPIRRALVIFATVAMVGAAGLVAAGAVDRRGTAFSLQVPNSGPVVVLGRSQRVCQGPLTASAAFRGVQLWLAPASAPGARFLVSATGPGVTALSSGVVMVGAPAQLSARAWLDRTIPAGTRLSLCFDNAGPGALSLTGGPANRDSGALERNGHALGSAAAMVMLSPRPSSMLELLPKAFTRAALFRPTWMGAWTYWILLAAIIAAFPVVAMALRLAARADAEP